MTTQTIPTETITAHWDTQGDTYGWYAIREREDGSCIDDSVKVWWPVDLDDYTEDDSAAVESALRTEWPDATIEVR